jgi:hypothetical protein
MMMMIMTIITAFLCLDKALFSVLTVIRTIQVWTFRLLNFPHYISRSKNNINYHFITVCYLKITKADLYPCIVISKRYVATVQILDSKLKSYIKKYINNADEISTNTSHLTKPDWQTKTPWEIIFLEIVEPTIK